MTAPDPTPPRPTAARTPRSHRRGQMGWTAASRAWAGIMCRRALRARSWWLGALLAVAATHAAPAQLQALHRAVQPAPAVQASLPPPVLAALQQAGLPPSAMSVVLQEAGGAPWLAWRADLPVNPASLFKLVTTYAALDRLGPAWTWTTPVWINGELRDGVLHGSVAIEGRGDPRLVLERVWLLLRRLQQEGVQEIRGDLLLDHGFFRPPARQPGDFDQQPLRAQNVQPDALLLNQKVVEYRFAPDPARGVARVVADPELNGVRVDREVPLGSGPCEDWRAALRLDLDSPGRVRFAGQLPAACGARTWRLAVPDPLGYGVQLVARMWQDLGGRLGGVVRDGAVPSDARLLFEQGSPTLAEVVRDINKFSNNTLAEQLFLSLAAPAAASTPVPAAAAPVRPDAGQAPATAAAAAGTSSAPASASISASASAPEPVRYPGPPAPVDSVAARAALSQWLAERFGADALQGLVLDNGSGLSRETRLSAALLARVLQHAWASPVMPEFIASLPVAGTDGTMRRFGAATGRAHLKTGSLRDVAALAGYLHADNGRRYVVVAIVQHAQAHAARPALDALLRWAQTGAP